MTEIQRIHRNRYFIRSLSGISIFNFFHSNSSHKWNKRNECRKTLSSKSEFHKFWNEREPEAISLNKFQSTVDNEITNLSKNTKKMLEIFRNDFDKILFGRKMVIAFISVINDSAGRFSIAYSLQFSEQWSIFTCKNHMV